MLRWLLPACFLIQTCRFQELVSQRQRVREERERLHAQLEHFRRCLTLPSMHWGRGGHLNTHMPRWPQDAVCPKTTGFALRELKGSQSSALYPKFDTPVPMVTIILSSHTSFLFSLPKGLEICQRFGDFASCIFAGVPQTFLSQGTFYSPIKNNKKISWHITKHITKSIDLEILTLYELSQVETVT